MGLQPVSNTNDVIRILSQHDSAIDDSATNVEAYAADHDLKHLHLVHDPASPPVWFTLRAVEKSEAMMVLKELSGIDDELVKAQRYYEELFRLGCTKIEGLTTPSKSGKPMPVFVKVSTSAGRPPRMTDDVFRAVPSAVRYEMGCCVHERSFLTEEHAKNS